MDITVTKIFNQCVTALKDEDIALVVLRGGLRSSKTISILQLLTIYAIKHPNTEILFVSSTFKKVMLSLFKDWKKLAIGNLYTKIGEMNLTNGVYTFKNGSSIRFQTGNLKGEEYRGDAYDFAFIDEVNNIKKEVYDEITDRIRSKVFVAFNPSAKFYITDEVENRNDVVEIISTFKDNPFVSNKQKERWLAKGKRDANYQRVMVLGEYGSVEGLILTENTNWEIIDEIPTLSDKTVKEYFGVDWGFKPDPASINYIKIIGDSIFIDECVYETELITPQIAEKIKYHNSKNEKMIADNARPEIIAELKRIHGINIEGVKKPGILESIDLLKQKKIFVTERSFNVIQELRYYTWGNKKDKHGNIMPIDNWNHAIDNIRYVTSTHFRKPNNTYTSIKL